MSGRWTTKDPIGFASGTSNFYEYASSDPINFVDYEGEAAIAAAGSVAAAAGAAAGLACISMPSACAQVLEDIWKEIKEGDWGGPKPPPTADEMGKKSGKEKASDIPSWAKGQTPKPGESGKDFADRLLKDKYGPNSYPKGPGSEHNKLKNMVIDASS